MTVNALALATQIAEPVTSATTQNLQLGQDHYTAGGIDDAIVAFQAGLDAAGRDSAGSP
jgi:predicted TPR repeat methyltransferase